ncbi:tripartite tricarboxylate transporter substrate binding protein [Diaphorobacter sp. HDW4A]|uniref:Bug family tripartite tricarboxylate transporter substrate binding protein n=1 Tax=Diaphorobacter sp. HDW4A TaxID=2714924 RepID=UPI00140A241B|nr:tripartite tricarboxylate transporter substrate binding protein [Diaphorobacter sp. HDW4A]QIL78646.1 tripartite tricarboxylate transporter substrate binding protein [Diaphorobacter sp. HDW4A]
MTLKRRHWLAAACMALACAGAPTAWAQTYPSQPIRLIVPFAPGGAVDQTARIIGNTLGEKLGQSIVIENKPGASGSLGAGELHRAKPDGYTLMLALDSQAVNHHTVKNLPFDTFKDFDYLSLLVTTPQVLVVRNEMPAKNFDELVAYLKANPKASYASAGTASAGHVNSAQLSIAKGLKTEHVPYKGAAPLLTDLLGGHVDYAFAGLSVMNPQIKAGKLRALAVSSPKRSALLPDVPAMNELIPGFEFPTWIGIVAPPGMPGDVRAKLLKATQDTMHDPQVAKKFAENAFDVVASAPEVFTARVRKDSDVMADLVKRKIVTSD